MPLYVFACGSCENAPEVEVLTTFAKAEQVKLTCQCGALMERKLAAHNTKLDGSYSWRNDGRGRR